MMDDESETKTEWIGEKEQVTWCEEKKETATEVQGEKHTQQVNSNVIAIRSIWSWSEITACDDKYWSDKTTEAEIWADMNTGRVEWLQLHTHTLYSPNDEGGVQRVWATHQTTTAARKSNTKLGFD